jgi:hypothetical protein
MAKDMGVLLFTADIIYHLFDRFTEHMEVCESCLSTATILGQHLRIRIHVSAHMSHISCPKCAEN